MNVKIINSEDTSFLFYGKIIKGEIHDNKNEQT